MLTPRSSGPDPTALPLLQHRPLLTAQALLQPPSLARSMSMLFPMPFLVFRALAIVIIVLIGLEPFLPLLKSL